MKKRILVPIAIGLVLAGTVAGAQQQPTAQQNNDFVWDGPGYYAEEPGDWGHGNELMKVGGPFPTFADCDRYLGEFPDHATNTTRMCAYRGRYIAYHQP